MIEAQTKDRIWRFSSIALFCGLSCLLLALAVSNVMSANEAADQTARKRATASTIVAQLEKHRSRTTRHVDTASLYLKSASETLARAEIQERTSKLVEEAGGRLAEAQLSTTPEQEAAGTVAIQLLLDIDNKGLLDLLYAIESGLPLLEIIDLDAQRSGHEGDAGGDQRALHVDMKVQAHWRKSTG